MTGNGNGNGVDDTYELAVIGSGPAGQQAAIQAGRSGHRAIVVEQEVSVGGMCVHRGTIPSKTLRETALTLSEFQHKIGDVVQIRISEELQVASLMTRMEHVIKAHTDSMLRQLSIAGVESCHGRASFVSPREIEVLAVDGTRQRIRSDHFVIATGSRPRNPPEIPIDHAHVLDSDSILSMTYLPSSLMVLGGGVIACEYASIFTALGVEVYLYERHGQPLRFLDPEVTDGFRNAFEAAGGKLVRGSEIASVEWDEVSSVVTTLKDGTRFETDKLLCCLGREGNVEHLKLQNIGVNPNRRGLLEVNENYQTRHPHIYAVGDVIGPPSLASTSMGQGVAAASHALGLGQATSPELIPMGIYTIPEIASVGLSEREARERYGEITIGRAQFGQVARGHIADCPNGFLKIIADTAGERLFGVQVFGENASELVHIGKMALINGNGVEIFLNHTFNFPTMAEAYRIAALDIAWQRSLKMETIGPAR